MSTNVNSVTIESVIRNLYLPRMREELGPGLQLAERDGQAFYAVYLPQEHPEDETEEPVFLGYECQFYYPYPEPKEWEFGKIFVTKQMTEGTAPETFVRYLSLELQRLVADWKNHRREKEGKTPT